MRLLKLVDAAAPDVCRATARTPCGVPEFGHSLDQGFYPVGFEYTIVAVTCSFSQQGVAVRRRSGTRA